MLQKVVTRGLLEVGRLHYPTVDKVDVIEIFHQLSQDQMGADSCGGVADSHRDLGHGGPFLAWGAIRTRENC